jgi:hypothetical protein
MLAPWSAGEGGTIGIGVEVTGRCRDSTDDILRSTRTIWNRFDQWFRGGRTVPLYAKWLISWTVEADLDLMQALCAVAADRPDARRHLDDRVRVERLLRDFELTRLRSVPQKMGSRRKNVEIMTAMRMLGFEHELSGRPLPDEDLVDTHVIAAKVLDRIGANPYAQGIDVDEEQVLSIIERTYTGVEPWPFAALLDE